MITLSLRPNCTFHKRENTPKKQSTLKSFITASILMMGALFTLSVTVSTFLFAKGMEYNLPDDMPQGVKKYMQSLPTIQASKVQDSITASKEIVRFLCSMNSSSSGSIFGEDILEDRIQNIMDKEQPLSMVIVGYPFKSTNCERKVLSDRFDMGDYIGLLTLNHICEQIESIYPHGASITIYPDGNLCNHLLDVKDDVVDAYQRTLQTLVQRFNGHIRLRYITIDEKLSDKAPIDPLIQKRIQVFMKEEFNCTHWKNILEESILSMSPDLVERLSQSKTKKKAEVELRQKYNKLLREKCEFTALRATQLQYCFGEGVKLDLEGQDYVRLSIHAIPNVSIKCGIASIFGSQGTPWHQTTVISRHFVTLQKMSDLKKKEDLEDKNMIIDSYQVDGIDLSYVIDDK